MIISVASGKGGTGKTTISTNLALSNGYCQFLDCDVEEPNSNIFLKTKIEKKEEVTLGFPEIDKSKCDFCGKCSEFCQYNAIAVVPSNIIVFPELCHFCGGCELVCPKNAVNWNKRSIGIVEHGKSKKITYERRQIEESNALKMELESFVESVKTGNRPAVSGEEGKEALRVAIEITDMIKSQVERLIA